MPGKKVRMLFIGNSFTTKNDLPTLLSAIAKAGKGITIESKIISAGGASLRRHWNRRCREYDHRCEMGLRRVPRAEHATSQELQSFP